MSVDLADPKTFNGGVPHDEFDRLRRDEPVHWTSSPVGGPSGGFWSLTRYADIATAGRDVSTFSNTYGPGLPVSPPAELENMRDNVMFNDPPRHGELRRLVGTAFSPRVVARFADWITERVNIILDDLAGRGACDLVPLMAVELPAQVICSIMGVPGGDRPQVVAWADAIFSRQIPGHAESSVAAIQETMQYALRMRDDGCDSRDANMMSELAEAERDGVKITDSEYMQLVMSLLIAGFETTHTLIGQSMRMILEDPEIEAQVVTAARGGDTKAVVEEFLRMVTPAMHMIRRVTQETTLHDVTMKEGDTVALWFVAANRDPSVFENPHAYNAARTSNVHQSFGGGGPHFCIGNHLARLEVQILLREMFTRGPKVTLNGTPERGWTNFINQLRTLPVVSA